MYEKYQPNNQKGTYPLKFNIEFFVTFGFKAIFNNIKKKYIQDGQVDKIKCHCNFFPHLAFN